MEACMIMFLSTTITYIYMHTASGHSAWTTYLKLLTV